MNDELDFDINLAKKFRNTLRGDTIDLPFPYLFLWWENGQAHNVERGDWSYYGGWFTSLENAENAVAEIGPLPPTFKQGKKFAKNGDVIEGYGTRMVAVAVFANRTLWTKDKDTGKAKSKTHYLCYMGYMNKETKQYEPWGPAVLSIKGWASNDLKKAIAEFGTKTAKARAQHAAGIPPTMFYAALGTFEKEPVTKQVGKKGAQSPITPPHVYLPGEITRERIRSWFVGRETMVRIDEYYEAAHEWLEAWKNGETETDDQEFGTEQEEEIPF